VAVGFDILGFPLEAIGDTVTVTRIESARVELSGITGEASICAEDLNLIPLDPARNCATVGLMRMLYDLRLDFGFRVGIHKGIGTGSGMGGSAASSVGALVAANALLERPLSQSQLLDYALLGEECATGTAHADNVTPCLYGGLTLTLGPEVVRLPTPPQILCVLVHPHLVVETRAARAVLNPELALRDHVRQSALLAGFVAGCYTGEITLLRRCLRDLVVEPQRKVLIPGFDDAQASALAAGAIGCSISGSGPSMFAWTESPAQAEAVREAMVATFRSVGCESWISPISSSGAHLV
jgi:homoserine kinase